MATKDKSSSEKSDSQMDKNQEFITKCEAFSDFLTALDGYSPTIPAEVVSYYMKKVGVEHDDSRVTKMIALASDRFLAKIMEEAKQINAMRGGKHQAKKQSEISSSSSAAAAAARREQKSTQLHSVDVSKTLAFQRISLRRKLHERR